MTSVNSSVDGWKWEVLEIDESWGFSFCMQRIRHCQVNHKFTEN
jgi:hypothetical protein